MAEFVKGEVWMAHTMQHTMLLHGLGQNSDSWKKVIDCLPPEQKEQLYTPDFYLDRGD